MALTAETVKKYLWMNSEACIGDILHINREYLAYLLKELERDATTRGFEVGYTMGLQTVNKSADADFGGKRAEW